MTEISYITQNGQQIFLKDAAGREMLETKQPKLKAGKGISIAEDGTISATGGNGGSALNTFIVNEVAAEAYGTTDSFFDVEFSYIGNISLLHNGFIDSEASSGSKYPIDEWLQNEYGGGADSLIISYEDYIPDNISDIIGSALLIKGEEENLENTGEDYLYIFCKKITIVDSDYNEFIGSVIPTFACIGLNVLDTFNNEQNEVCHNLSCSCLFNYGEYDYPDCKRSWESGRETQSNMFAKIAELL